MRKRWMRLALWCVILVLLAAIALFSAQNGEASQKLSDGVVQRLLTLFWPGYAPATAQEQARVWQTAVLVVRKGAHATEFLLLGAALYLLLPPTARWTKYTNCFLPGARGESPMC